VNVVIHETAPTPFALASAILLYRSAPTDRAAGQTTAMHHPVREDPGGGLRLGAGTPVTAGLLEGLRELLDDAPLTYVPPEVVAVGRGAIAWFEPAATRTMFFNARSDAATQAFDGMAVPQPPLVFVARNHALRVFALRENARPALETPLAAAPYWNVYEDGRVCLGSTTLPSSLEPTQTAAWTRSFFASNFTHMNTGKRWAYAGTYAQMLHEAVRTGTFDPAWLQQPFTTIRAALCG
jgi:PRTRC genetic system protein B